MKWLLKGVQEKHSSYFKNTEMFQVNLIFFNPHAPFNGPTIPIAAHPYVWVVGYGFGFYSLSQTIFHNEPMDQKATKIGVLNPKLSPYNQMSHNTMQFFAINTVLLTLALKAFSSNKKGYLQHHSNLVITGSIIHCSACWVNLAYACNSETLRSLYSYALLILSETT